MGYFRNKSEFLAYICNTALPEFRNGNLCYGKVLQEVFLFPEEIEIQALVANAYRRWMDCASSKKLIRMSEEFRKNFFDGWYLGESEDGRWKRAAVDRKSFFYLSDASYGAMLKFGTWMGNGYYRERCVEALDGQDNALFFLVLRVNDWVDKVRERAFGYAYKRMQECGVQEIFFALPALEKIRNSERRDISWLECLEKQAGKVLAEKFTEISEQTLREISDYEINIKNAIYRFVSKNKVLRQEQMEFLFLREKTGYGKVTLLLGIFSFYGYTEETIEQYLLCKNAAVRYCALQYRYEKEQRAWAGLSSMLLDSSKRVRVYAGYILKKHTEIDLLNFYKEQLEKGSLKVALMGIGEQGGREQLKDISPFLESENNLICKMALVSYAKLAMESGGKVYWRFLFDSRPEISRLAYRCICKYHIHYGASYLYKILLEYCETASRESLLNLLLCEPSWERLPYLLLLYGREEFSEEEQKFILSGINNRYTYGVVSVQQGEKIREILEQQRTLLPDNIVEEIRFDLRYVVRKTDKR